MAALMVWARRLSAPLMPSKECVPGFSGPTVDVTIRRRIVDMARVFSGMAGGQRLAVGRWPDVTGATAQDAVSENMQQGYNDNQLIH